LTFPNSRSSILIQKKLYAWIIFSNFSEVFLTSNYNIGVLFNII